MSRRTSSDRASRIREQELQLAAIEGDLDAGFSDLVRFWSVVTPVFREATAGVTHTRRPAFSVRLPVVGDPPAILAVAPGWNPVQKVVCPDLLVFDFTVERIPGNAATELTFSFNGATPRPGQWSRRWVDESVARVLDTVRAFLADPAQVFAQASDHCCICGRSLTDPVSRGRGIGPECLGRANGFREAVERFFSAQGVSPEREQALLRDMRARAASERDEIAARRQARQLPATTPTQPADPQTTLFT